MTNRAVIVGYSKYDHFEPLDGVTATVDCFESMLSYCFEEQGVFDAVEKLIDEEPGYVNDKIDEIFSQVEPRDRTSLILIGHGKVWSDESPSLKLASHLAKPEAENEAHWLTVGNLASKLEGSTSADRLMLLDCCGAGFYDLQSLDPEKDPISDPDATSMDGSLDHDSLAKQVQSKKVRATLSGKDGRVATIVTTASDKAAWLGKLLPPKEFQGLVSMALAGSPFISSNAKYEPTYFCQAAAVCHYVASNYDDLRNDRGSLNSDEQGLIREISRLMQPDNDGRFWAKDVTQAAAHLLKRLETAQEPRFLPPESGKSYMALLRVAGPSRKERLAALYARMNSYPSVSEVSRTSVLEQITKMAETRVRERSSKMKALESDLLDVPEGSEYLVVESILKSGLAFAVAEEVEAARFELGKEFEAEIAARKSEFEKLKQNHDTVLTEVKLDQKNELEELKAGHKVLIEQISDALKSAKIKIEDSEDNNRSLQEVNDVLKKRLNRLWMALIAVSIPSVFFALKIALP